MERCFRSESHDTRLPREIKCAMRLSRWLRGWPAFGRGGQYDRRSAAVSSDGQDRAEGRENIVAWEAAGGVGKSTIAVNIAASLAAQGARCRLLDGDIYGPPAHHAGHRPAPQSVKNR